MIVDITLAFKKNHMLRTQSGNHRVIAKQGYDRTTEGSLRGADIMSISPAYHGRIALRQVCRVPLSIVSATRAVVGAVSRQLRLNTGRRMRTASVEEGCGTVATT